MRISDRIALFVLFVTGLGLASAFAFDGSSSTNTVASVASADIPRTAMVGPVPNTAVMPWEPAPNQSFFLSFSNLRVPDGALKLTPSDAYRWGTQAMRIGNIPPGVRAIEYAAANGHPIAQWKLGHMFAEGDGVTEDHLRAFGYFSKLAEGHAEDRPGTAISYLVSNAFVALGNYYREGIPNSPVKPDLDRARSMFSYAAFYFGDRDAQYNLARMYLEGMGVPKDPKVAARWLSLAADKGQHQAQALLGEMLIKGAEVPRRSALGLMWLTLAADSASPQEAWIVQMHDDASKQASEEDRALALNLLEKRLRGSDRGE